MKTKRRVRDDERKTIISMYQAGYTLEAICRETGRFRATVTNVLIKADLYVPGKALPRERAPQAKASDAEIRKAFARGFADATPHERSLVAHATARALA